MVKRSQKLAAEITAAWVKTFQGQPWSDAVQLSDALAPEKVAEVYRTVFRAIYEEQRIAEAAERSAGGNGGRRRDSRKDGWGD